MYHFWGFSFEWLGIQCLSVPKVKGEVRSTLAVGLGTEKSPGIESSSPQRSNLSLQIHSSLFLF